jgi:hypothetical protein
MNLALRLSQFLVQPPLIAIPASAARGPKKTLCSRKAERIQRSA